MSNPTFTVKGQGDVLFSDLAPFQFAELLDQSLAAVLAAHAERNKHRGFAAGLHIYQYPGTVWREGRLCLPYTPSLALIREILRQQPYGFRHPQAFDVRDLGIGYFEIELGEQLC